MQNCPKKKKLKEEKNIGKKMNSEISVKNINYGIACRIGNRIYINKKLRKYPKLYKAIFNHELDHSSGYTKKDIVMDLHNNHISELKYQYYEFILSHPSSWVELLPGWFYEGRFVLAPLTTALWGFAIIISGLIWRFIL